MLIWRRFNQKNNNHETSSDFPKEVFRNGFQKGGEESPSVVLFLARTHGLPMLVTPRINLSRFWIDSRTVLISSFNDVGESVCNTSNRSCFCHCLDVIFIGLGAAVWIICATHLPTRTLHQAPCIRWNQQPSREQDTKCQELGVSLLAASASHKGSGTKFWYQAASTRCQAPNTKNHVPSIQYMDYVPSATH